MPALMPMKSGCIGQLKKGTRTQAMLGQANHKRSVRSHGKPVVVLAGPCLPGLMHALRGKVLWCSMKHRRLCPAVWQTMKGKIDRNHCSGNTREIERLHKEHLLVDKMRARKDPSLQARNHRKTIVCDRLSILRINMKVAYIW